MAKKGPDPPTPPDPTVVANAQSAANIASSTAQQKLNMLGSSGPSGTVNWVADPTQPGGYTQNTTLSPAQQQLYNSSVGLQGQALGVGQTALTNAGNALDQSLTNPNLTTSIASTPVQTSVGQTAPVQSSIQGTNLQTSLGDAGPIQTSSANPQAQSTFNQGQAVQGQVGSQDINQSVTDAQNAAYQQATSRLDPQWAQAQNQESAQLANQGLSVNSAAYQNAMNTFNQGKNDAYNQANFSAVAAGNAEQNTLYGQQLQSGQFANAAAGQQFNQGLQGQQAYNAAAAQNSSQGLAQANLNNTAQQQAYTQNLGAANFANTAANQQFVQNQSQGQFANAAQDQTYQQQLAAGQFANQASGQQFSQDQSAAQFANQAAGQGLQDQAYVQNQPINQAATLMGLGQVTQPTAPQYTSTSVAPTDVTGAYALNSQVAQANYAQQMAQQQSLLGGLFGLGSSAIALSDVRLKRDLIPLNGEIGGFPVYSFRYVGDQTRHIGVMAQDVIKSRPDAVITHPSGFMLVDYGAL